ncbi:hypothetical protein EJP77_11720 [Paenibacillus zeisoli]|uniref:SLH domain-containing protein n=1 Tax=Paenibacillus zeisoli TaxID=2496267 RepID=A0A433X952_9BACL|nr:InlB B-repeat-containing protein [Paenibacillus zeisoli]RUT30498.1 hypothetical protein EJP77_11720 [Paenibacillus zeisoli]
MRLRGLSVLLCFSIVLSMFPLKSLPANAEAWSLRDAAGWKAVYPANNQNDYQHDQQTGSGSVSQDIVGDANYPSTFMHFTDTEIALRVRVNHIDGGTDAANYQFKNFSFAGIDADLNGSVDFFLGIYNPTGNNGRLGIYGSNSGYANTGPSTTGISGKPLMAFKPVNNVNYSITKAADGSNFDGNSDYFISYKFSVADIKSALAAKGYNFDSSTPFRFMTGTAAQDNSFNQDLNGMDRTGWSSKGTWNSLGVFSNVVSANGSIPYYTVNFDKNTGDTEASPAFKVIQAGGTTLGSLPVLPTKRSMYFQEWNTKPDGTGETITANTVINASTSVYAIWGDKKVYTVTFMNGTDTLTTVPTKNGIVGDNMPSVPVGKQPYFIGWNTTSSGTGSWLNSTTAVTQNTTVYAIFTNSGESAVFFNNYTPNGGSIVATLYSNGNSGNFGGGGLPTITRTGYVFGGWYNNTAGTGTAVTTLGKGSAGNYYAKWTPAVYTVTFNGNGGSDPVNNVPDNKAITNGTFGDMPTAKPTRTGYSFIEWNRSPDGSGEAIYPSTVISESATVYAIWKASKTVTFNVNGGEGENQLISAVDGKLDYLPQPPFRENYTFLGWGTSAGATTVVNIQDVTAYTELFAVWSPVYTVNFDANQGDWEGSAQTSILTAYGSVLYIPEAPVRENYVFGGWNTGADGNGVPFTLSTSVTKDNTTVYAKWASSASAFTVKFEANGGSSIDDMTTNQIEAAPASAKPGYTLEGWYSDPGLNTDKKVSFPYQVTANTTLYAKWTANTSSVTLSDNGGSGGSESVTAAYDQPMPDAAVPNRTGYTFTGYYDQASGGTKYYNADMSSAKDWDKTESASTLYAQWEAAVYAVTFDANGGQYAGGTATADLNQTYDSNYELPSVNPTRSGYTFASWNLQDDGKGTTITGNTKVKEAGAHHVYAVWTEVGSVMINYAANDTSYGTVSQANESLNPETSTASGSEATAKPGYHFVEWQDGNGTSVSTNPTFVPQKVDGSYVSGTYTAVFAANTYHITYDLDGGKTASSNPTTYTTENDSFTLINPTKPGYTFGGWTGTGLSDPTVTVIVDTGSTGDRSYSATWTANTSSVTLDANGGTGGSSSVTAIYDQPMPEAEAPSRTGYAFIGYFDRTSGGTKYYNADMSSAKNWDNTGSTVTLYAQWQSTAGYDVVGTVVDEATPPVHIQGAKVEIVKGNTSYGDTGTTDAEGNFTIHNVPAGTYNLRITLNEKTAIIAIIVKGETRVIHLGNVIFPYNASSALNLQGNGTPAIVIDNLHPEAEDYLLKEKNNTGFAKVEMKIGKIDEATSDTHALEAMSNIKPKARNDNLTIGLYLDMTIEKFYRITEAEVWNSEGLIGQTKGLIKVIIPIPSDLYGKSGYAVYRYHGNAVNFINSVPNADGEYLAYDSSDQTLTLYVRNFSVYAIAYNNPQVEVPSGTGGGTQANFAVTFDGDGGTSSTTTQSVAIGDLLTKPADPIRTGYIFDGWYKADGSKWNFSTDRVYSNITLTAKWTVAATDAPALDKVNHFAYMKGYPDRTFGSEKNMTRAEATVMFARLLVNKMDVGKSYPSKFKDIDSRRWYANAIGYMEQYGIISGYSGGTFRPNAPITRAEFAAMSSRFDKLITGEPVIFTDVKDNYWAKDYISFASSKGWIKGYQDGTFRPEQSITRAEVVSLANRMLERSSDKSYLTAHKDVLSEYVDLTTGHWAYYDIMEATNAHDYEKNANGETWIHPKK